MGDTGILEKKLTPTVMSALTTRWTGAPLAPLAGAYPPLISHVSWFRTGRRFSLSWISIDRSNMISMENEQWSLQAFDFWSTHQLSSQLIMVATSSVTIDTDFSIILILRISLDNIYAKIWQHIRHTFKTLWGNEKENTHTPTHTKNEKSSMPGKLFSRISSSM